MLRLSRGAQQAATFSGTARALLGQPVIAVGYPLRGLLASDISVTTGAVSALAGIGDDTRLLQMTAPIKPGNSGGPLLDQSGNVVGIMVGQLDALKYARATGDIPQNVNFAIKESVARAFLDANGVRYGTTPSTGKLETPQVAERTRRFTVLVECWK